MKKSIVAGLLLIFVSFSIMAENIGNMPSSVNEVKSGNEILLKCLNIVGESTQGTEITENNGNNIFLKCLNFENISENTVTTNKINSKDILLECLDTSKNTSDEMVKNENSDEKILKCSNLVKIINSNELFQTEKIENINGVQLKC